MIQRLSEKEPLVLFITGRIQEKEGTSRVENLDGGDSSIHLPLTTLKLNRKDHDFKLGIFSAESQVATGQARPREGSGKTRRLTTDRVREVCYI